MGPSNIKIEPHDEWRLMIERLENMPDDLLMTTWDALTSYNSVGYYAEGITMDSWSQAVYSEMSHRGMPYDLPIRVR